MFNLKNFDLKEGDLVWGMWEGWKDFYNRIFSKKSMFSRGVDPHDTVESIRFIKNCERSVKQTKAYAQTLIIPDRKTTALHCEV